MRDRIRIERQVYTVSASGQSKPTWVSLHECWANIRALAQGQQLRADQTVGPVTHEIRIRAFPGVDHKCRIISTDYDIDATPTMVFVFGGAAVLLTHYSTTSVYGTSSFDGSPVTDWFVGPDGSAGSGTNQACLALNDEGNWSTGSFTSPGDGEHELIGLGDATGAYTGTVDGGDLVIDSPNFASFNVPDTDRIFMVDGVIDPDGKRSDMIIQAVQVKQ